MKGKVKGRVGAGDTSMNPLHSPPPSMPAPSHHVSLSLLLSGSSGRDISELDGHANRRRDRSQGIWRPTADWVNGGSMKVFDRAAPPPHTGGQRGEGRRGEGEGGEKTGEVGTGPSSPQWVMERWWQRGDPLGFYYCTTTNVGTIIGRFSSHSQQHPSMNQSMSCLYL